MLCSVCLIYEIYSAFIHHMSIHTYTTHKKNLKKMKFKQQQQQQQQRQQTRNHDFERVLPQIFGLIWILVVSVYIVYACMHMIYTHKT